MSKRKIKRYVEKNINKIFREKSCYQNDKKFLKKNIRDDIIYV